MIAIALNLLTTAPPDDPPPVALPQLRKRYQPWVPRFGVRRHRS